MAQSLFIPSPMGMTGIPASPDPTPLRLLAFSVAEAALQSDPNSPSFNTTRVSHHQNQNHVQWSMQPQQNAKNSKMKLWNVAERARERHDKVSPLKTQTEQPPSDYTFVLPPNSPLAASISTEQPFAQLSLNPIKSYTSQTRSAEPSPIKSTFARLDQSRPPPVFIPRLSAREFSAEAQRNATSVKHSRTKSDIGLPSATIITEPSSPSERLRAQAQVVTPKVPLPGTGRRLPSLAQIHARVSEESLRRNSQPGNVPKPRGFAVRSDSDESLEILQTPVEEKRNPMLSISIVSSDSRPSTPPSPSKEPRLAPFLRDRTFSRLANVRPPLSIQGRTSPKPTLTVTPPSTENRPPPLTLFTNKFAHPSPTRATLNMSPTEMRFPANLTVSTPPPRNVSSPSLGSPVSPTGSTKSFRSSSTASPTLSIPRITCTPAKTIIIEDGVERESDEESEDEEVVVFDGEKEAEEEREERERRARAMKDRLSLRRRSD
ncbi:hypothetical protein M231_05040 [Tremella mesenterica]|uniref:Uncharacterized protein n=1 Tax=Tremella mesenterica TaxID=5217 RepID=A0A4V1M3Q7_TREME|nr:hypothetical protein M231_05040 [Tremella mesenterica]